MGKQPGYPKTAWLGLGLALVIATAPHLPAQSAKSAKRADFPEETPATSDPEPATPPKPGGLRMSRAVVCRTINGYEDFEPLKDAAQTSEEKLLIYYRPLRYKIDLVDDLYRAHLIQDNEIRKRGDKKVIRQKRKVVEYAPKSRQPLGPLYIRNMISLKGLKPGDYELTMILHDELDKGSPPTKQVVKFKIIPTPDPRSQIPEKRAEGPPPGR